MEVRGEVCAGLRTTCLVAGPEAAPPVLLLHGGGIDRAARSWAEVLPGWRERFRLYAPDLPGYGDTEGFAGAHGIPELGAWALALMDALGLDRVHAVGNSMGGGIALWLAFHHPDRIDRLVPVGAYGLARRHWAQPALWLHTRAGGSRLIAQMAARSDLGARIALRALFEDPSRIRPHMVPEMRAEAKAQARRQSFRRFLEGEVGPFGFRTSYYDRLPQLQHETLIVHGRSDRILPVRIARRAAPRLPAGQLWEMDTGHWPMRECPAVFCQRVGHFLSEGFAG